MENTDPMKMPKSELIEMLATGYIVGPLCMRHVEWYAKEYAETHKIEYRNLIVSVIDKIDELKKTLKR